MVALTAPRNTPVALGEIRSVPVKAATKVFQGGMVQIDATGHAVPASATIANVTIGRADETADNSAGANAAINVKVRRGVFKFANSAAGDLIARTEIGKDCYVVDDQTVAKTNNGGARPVAGKVFGVDAQGVWVEIL
jgi:hypothetical protein